LIVADQGKVNEAALKALGARGVIRPSEKAIQIVLGPIADQVAGDMRKVVARGPATPSSDSGALLAAFGGRANLASVMAKSSRLLVEVKDAAKVTESDLRQRAPRGVVQTSQQRWQVLAGPDAAALAAQFGA
jgi:PTS system N-acetylglucosamine-specific IIC component